MIVGNDISGIGQGQINWPVFEQNTNFVLMKATEGAGIVDTWFGNNRQQARNDYIPRMFYHFARPDLGNTALSEAQFFEAYIDGNPIERGENIGLDCEVDIEGLPAWVQAWCEEIHTHYNNISVWLYLDQSRAKSYDWSSVIALGYVKLWGAYYTGNPNVSAGADFGGWGNLPHLRQWTNTESVPGINGNVDGDDFDGTVNDFLASGYQPIVIPTVSVVPSQTVQSSTTAGNGETVVTPTPTQTGSSISTPPVVTPPISTKSSLRNRLVVWLKKIIQSL